MHPLVVGGTGILRSASETLTRHGSKVTVLVRGATEGPPQVFAAEVGVRDGPTLGAALDDAIAASG